MATQIREIISSFSHHNVYDLIMKALKNFEDREDYKTAESTLQEEIENLIGVKIGETTNGEELRLQENFSYLKHIDQKFIKFYQKIVGPKSLKLKSESSKGKYIILSAFKNIAVPKEWAPYLGRNNTPYRILN